MAGYSLRRPPVAVHVLLVVLFLGSCHGPSQRNLDPRWQTWALHVDARAVAVAANQLLVLDENRGLEGFSLENPDQPRLLWTLPQARGALAIAVDGDRVALSCGAAGTLIVQIDARGGRVTGHLPAVGFARGAALHGDLLVVAEGEAGVRTARIDYRGRPQATGSWTTSSSDPLQGFDAGLVALHGNRAVVADFWNGAVMLDLSDPSSPRFLGAWDVDPNLPGGNHSLATVALPTGFVSHDHFGSSLVLLDSTGVLRRTLRTPSPVAALHAAGSRLFVLLLDGEMLVLESSPHSPITELLRLDAGPDALHLVATAGRIYVAGGVRGLRVFRAG